MGTTEDRHTIRITGIKCIPVSTVIRVKPRWAQSTNPPCVYVSPAVRKRLTLKFNKCAVLFVGMHNKALSVIP
jgi:hypothetical protein